MKDTPKIAAFIIVILITTLACSFSGQDIIPVTGETPIPEVVAPPPVDTPIVVEEPPTPEAVEPTLPPPTPEPVTESPPNSITHDIIPISSLPPDKPQVMYDQDSIRSADKREAYGGDEFLLGKFERPFDQDMKYIPYIDIIEANMVRNKDDQFIYAIIRVQEDPSLSTIGPFGFGIEVDEDLDGSGDFLIWSILPVSNEWSVEGVSVWKDANADIGYLKPMFSEGPVTQDGYELNIFDAGSGQDSDLAWSRISPSDPLEIEIAFKRSVLEVSPYFLWGAWAALGPDQFDRFDHNDYFTYEQAGSPTKKQTDYYPLKELFAVDNTCRSASGFTPKGNEPGVCPAAIVEKKAKDKVCTEMCFVFGAQVVCYEVCE